MIPDAVAAVIAATLRDHPTSEPEAVARAAVAALDREGWHITAPDVIAAALRAA
ncbi:hypothetical protein ACFRQM_04395 [Streptomyces sp. NPDC056831]|uniref:hypothetical protein n=1 Tax=Streptomyces sp. NPDC056831 TaxID=3345954 RepID=UPI0036CEA599